MGENNIGNHGKFGAEMFYLHYPVQFYLPNKTLSWQGEDTINQTNQQYIQDKHVHIYKRERDVWLKGDIHKQSHKHKHVSDIISM